MKVLEDAIRDRKVRLIGVMYVEAHLLDHVGDVRPGEGEVLEIPD
jgi:hypothetical protein